MMNRTFWNLRTCEATAEAEHGRKLLARASMPAHATADQKLLAGAQLHLRQ